MKPSPLWKGLLLAALVAGMGQGRADAGKAQEAPAQAAEAAAPAASEPQAAAHKVSPYASANLQRLEAGSAARPGALPAGARQSRPVGAQRPMR